MRKHVVVVLGCYRSGTSCVSGMLRELGLDFGSCMGPGSNNPKGYFEETRLRRALIAGYDERHCQQVSSDEYLLEALRQWRRAWTGDGPAMIGVKHPLLCLMGDVLEKAFPNDRLSYVVTDRAAADIVKSLECCHWRWARGADLESIVNTLIAARERFLRDRPHVRVDFHELLSNPAGIARAISSHLGVNPDPLQLETAEKFVEPRVSRLNQTPAVEDFAERAHSTQRATVAASAWVSTAPETAPLASSWAQADPWIIENLLNIADVSKTSPLDLSKASPEIIRRFFTIARIHGVLGLLLQKLAGSPIAKSPVWEAAQRTWRAEIVQSLRNREHAGRIVRKFSSSGIRAALLKGLDFADSLYVDARLRPSTDLDILVPRDQWLAAARLLENMGYFARRRPPHLNNPHRTRGEATWTSLTLPKILVDLHWNVLNSPRWRREASIEFDDLEWERAPLKTHFPESAPTPATRLVVAVIHALCHHQFGRVRLLADIQRAARAITRKQEILEIGEIVARTRTWAYLIAGMAISSELLGDAGIELIRRQLMADTRFRVLDPIPVSLTTAARMSLTDLKSSPKSIARSHIRQWLRARA